MAISTVLKVTCVILICMVAAAPHAAAGLTCSYVVEKVIGCVSYVQGRGSTPPWGSPCCRGIRQLRYILRTRSDRRTSCYCLKTLSRGVSGVNYGAVGKLLGACGVTLPFRIGPHVNCNKIG
ncbi:hypothetical protein Nepgr_024974 [Nepenthes gracilis]|uniref:Non-specific lipid-transfer protein n=1 Tax=Nepenthes gracilis TaxID=150966 RepID=A0AAD3Y111_NEPGR|nr:hypothetical protein Nepgr_024974 [Nepenthes gracilis]